MEDDSICKVTLSLLMPDGGAAGRSVGLGAPPGGGGGGGAAPPKPGIGGGGGGGGGGGAGILTLCADGKMWSNLF